MKISNPFITNLDYNLTRKQGRETAYTIWSKVSDPPPPLHTHALISVWLAAEIRITSVQTQPPMAYAFGGGVCTEVIRIQAKVFKESNTDGASKAHNMCHSKLAISGPRHVSLKALNERPMALASFPHTPPSDSLLERPVACSRNTNNLPCKLQRQLRTLLCIG